MPHDAVAENEADDALKSRGESNREASKVIAALQHIYVKIQIRPFTFLKFRRQELGFGQMPKASSSATSRHPLSARLLPDQLSGIPSGQLIRLARSSSSPKK